MKDQKTRLLLLFSLNVLISLGLTIPWLNHSSAAQAQSKIALGLITPLVLEKTNWLTDTFDFSDKEAAGSQAAALTGVDDADLGRAIGQLSTDSAAFVSPAAFHQASNSSTGSSPASGFRFWPEGGYIYNTSSTTMTLIAPVKLPDGATLTKLSMVLFDANAANDVTAILFRKNLVATLVGGPPVETIIAAGTALNDSKQVFQVSNTTFAGPTSVSNQYGYYLSFQLAPNTNLSQLVFGFRLDYTGGAESGVQVVPLAAFRHNGDHADDARFDFNNGFVRNTGANQVCLMAPVDLPVGATMTQLRASIFDASDASNLSITLNQVELATGSASIPATVTSNGTGSAPNNEELASAAISVVVSSNYSYYLTTCFEANTGLTVGLFGARLFYTPPASSSTPQMVPAAAFLQASDTFTTTDDADNWLLDFSNHFLTSDNSVPVCLAAPLNLPLGGTISSFSVYVEDTLGAGNTSIFLDRTSYLGEWAELGKITSIDNGGIRTLTDTTINTNDSANLVAAGYNYHLSFCLPAGSGGFIKIYGAQVNMIAINGGGSVYLPILFKSEAPLLTTVLITNQTGGGLNYTVFNTLQGDITCVIANGAVNQACGAAFIGGTYNFKAVAGCGQKVGQRTYKSGFDALTPFRCE